jgi:hypothetical protein
MISGSGHFNITTKKQFISTVNKHKLVLVGYSSPQCHKCIIVENEYSKISDHLHELQVPFARADIDKFKSTAESDSIGEIPALVVYEKGKPLPYRGVHSFESVVAYIQKLKAPVAKKLNSVDEVTAFMKSRNQPQYSISTVMIVGFFAHPNDIEEDDYNEWTEVAKELKHNENIYFGVVTNTEVINWFKSNRTIDRSPSMLMTGEGDITKALNLDDFIGEGESVSKWITEHAVPLVGKLDYHNFKLYEKTNKPMLILFLDLTREHQSDDNGGV